MNKDGIFEIALFPIPGCVSFPQTIVPLHVFEPRYRQMIQDCIDKNMLLGVCHTKSIERFATRQTKEIKNKEELYEMYKQNLTTFSPEDVFSAGLVNITDQTEDGRYLVNIQMLKRFRIIEILQNKPYKIGMCEEYRDHHFIRFDTAEEKVKNQRSTIIDFLKQQLSKYEGAAETELLEIINEDTVNDFTFKLFKFYRLPEFNMQQILNSRHPIERLGALYQFTEELKKAS